MAILDIIEVPHPILAKRAREVTASEFGSDLVVLLRDMAETMYAAPGVGLAAPQIADSRRILVVDPGFEGEEGQQNKGRELYKMVNPRIIERSKETVIWEESLLSVLSSD